jgi:putative transposase
MLGFMEHSNFNPRPGFDRLPGEGDKDELIKRMFKVMLESMMEGERTAFLGYGKHDYSGYGSRNSRNGHYERDLLSGLGNLEGLNIPRDRLGEFFPELLDKWERATKPMDNLVLELYGRGMSTRDINAVVEKIYGKSLSPQAVTLVTKEIEEEREAWEGRPLKNQYVAIFADALVTKIRRDTVANDAVYVICGIDKAGYRDILGLYIGATESASFWKETFGDLKSRGVAEVLLFVTDGLSGMEEAIGEVFPRALTQRCVVHQIRATLDKVRPCHKGAVAASLKTIYRSQSLSEAKENILKVKSQWERFYPRLTGGWLEHTESLMRFLEFPEYLRPHLYTTNWIERLNKEFRKVLKTKNSLPTETAVRNLLYLKIREISGKWERQRLNGFVAYQVDLEILWERRYPSQERRFTQNG